MLVSERHDTWARGYVEPLYDDWIDAAGLLIRWAVDLMEIVEEVVNVTMTAWRDG